MSITIPSLPPGVYDVSATYKGYNKAVVRDITAYVAQLITVDLNLDVASTSDIVTVSSDAQLLETGSPQIDYIIGKKEMEDWPLIATSDGERDISQFLYNNLPGATGVSFTGSINGGQTRSNEIYLEGVLLGTMDTAEEGVLLPSLGMSRKSDTVACKVFQINDLILFTQVLWRHPWRTKKPG